MKKLQGKEGFLTYYQQFFPDQNEWEKFQKSLVITNQPILRFNPQNEKKLKQLWQTTNLPWKTHPQYDYALIWPLETPPGTKLPGYEEHLFYPMNPSSLLPVIALDPQPGETILDACAAPGGKALFIAEKLSGTGELIINDISPARRQRMKRLFENHHFTDIEIKPYKAELLFKKYPEHFDRILLDAPCSSEKHVFQNPHHLEKWKYSRVKNLARTQYSLLAGLLLALKPGGRLVYSTCSITPEENQQVIEKLLKKKGDHFKLKLISTQHILPHTTPGMDPMFVAVLEKEQ